MATHSSIIIWRIPWTEEPGRLESMGLQRVGHDWAESVSSFLPVKINIDKGLNIFFLPLSGIFSIAPGMNIPDNFEDHWPRLWMILLINWIEEWFQKCQKGLPAQNNVWLSEYLTLKLYNFRPRTLKIKIIKHHWQLRMDLVHQAITDFVEGGRKGRSYIKLHGEKVFRDRNGMNKSIWCLLYCARKFNLFISLNFWNNSVSWLETEFQEIKMFVQTHTISTWKNCFKPRIIRS